MPRAHCSRALRGVVWVSWDLRGIGPNLAAHRFAPGVVEERLQPISPCPATIPTGEQHRPVGAAWMLVGPNMARRRRAVCRTRRNRRSEFPGTRVSDLLTSLATHA